MRSWEFTKTSGNLPMCTGATDSTRIPIIAPVDDYADKVNPKGYHSVVMEAVVNSKYLFKDVVVGWLGPRHLNSFQFRSIQEGKWRNSFWQWRCLWWGLGTWRVPLDQPPAVAIVDRIRPTDATDVCDALAQYFALEVLHARGGRRV